MYKIKRFSRSIPTADDIDELRFDLSSLPNRFLMPPPNNKFDLPVSKFSLFGSSKSEVPDLLGEGGTVRSSYRLRSYLPRFDLKTFTNEVKKSTLELTNGTVYNSSDCIVINGKMGDPELIPILLINPDHNPIMSVYFHTYWTPLLNYSLYYSGVIANSDYFSIPYENEGKSYRALWMTVDDYGYFIRFLTYISVIAKIWGMKLKSNLVIQK